MKQERLRCGLLLLVGLLATSCGLPSARSVYYWKTTLAWTPKDTQNLTAAGIDRVGLRLFDWGVRGEEGPLVVRSRIPASMAVVPVVYVTQERLEAWAADSSLDARGAAQALFGRMDDALARAWSGQPSVWQLDADWTARTRNAWFAVVAAFRSLAHDRGTRFEVTLRLHQYRDRAAQGVPPADAVVLMLYGSGDAILDPALVEGYLKPADYPLPLTLAFPQYAQVRQYNGYGKLVALTRLNNDADLPLDALRQLDSGRFEVQRRSSLSGRVLLARDQLAVDHVSAADLERTWSLAAVRSLAAQSDNLWLFDYDPESWEAFIHGPLAPHLLSR